MIKGMKRQIKAGQGDFEETIMKKLSFLVCSYNIQWARMSLKKGRK